MKKKCKEADESKQYTVTREFLNKITIEEMLVRIIRAHVMDV